MTAGTFLHGCHVSLKHWFLASMLLNRVGGCSARELQRLTEVSYETVWQLLHRLRAAIADSNPMLSGPLTHATIGIATCRPYRCGSAAVPRNRSTIAGLMGEQGALFDQVPVAGDNGENAPAPHPLRTSLRLLRWQVARTHKGVSERWLRRYAKEHQHRNNVRPSAFLAASIRGPRQRFIELRPALEPSWMSGLP